MKLSSIFSKKHFILFLLAISFSTKSYTAIPFFWPIDINFKKKHAKNDANSASWSPDGRYFAVGGEGTEQVDPIREVAVYEWNGFSLTLTTSVTHGYDEALSVDWSPDGKYLAVGGSGRPLFKAVAVHKWHGSSLTLTTSVDHATQAWSVSWSPDGRYLAVGGVYGSTDVIVYEWDSSTSTLVDLGVNAKKDHGTVAYSVGWSPDGKYLAVGGNNGSNNDVIVYEWNGSKLTQKETKDHGNAARSVSWSPDGKYLAVGGEAAGYQLADVMIYEWNGSTLTATASKNHGIGSVSVDWSPDGRYLAVGGTASGYQLADVMIYEWDGSTLTATASADQGNAAKTVSWSPDGGYLVVGGKTDTDDKEVALYTRYGLIDGVRAYKYFTNTFPINDFGMAIGNVTFKKGISIAANRSFEANTGTKIFEQLNLNDTGKLFLFGDLCLGTDISGGIMYGNGNTIFLEHHAMTFSQSVLTFSSDTIIDGQGHDFVLGYSSQLLIDTDVTLTLRNLTLKNTKNWRTFPALKLTDSSSRLTFDNVEFAASDDFYFYNGQMYIHNDFVFTGTHSFIFKSDYPCFIEPKSTLHMEPETTFYYDTISSKNNNNELVIMQDKTSAIYLNGCTFMLSNTGLRLTKGQLFFANHVIIKTNTPTPPALDRYFIWGDHTNGTNYDLDVFILAGANVDLQGYVYYDNAA